MRCLVNPSRLRGFGHQLLLVAILVAPSATAAEPSWPSAREAWLDDFEGPSIDTDIWEDVGNGKVAISAAAAHPPSQGGLAVDVTGEGKAYLQRFNLDAWPHLEFPSDTYFRFAFHPNGVVIPDGDTVSIAVMRDKDWNTLAGLRIRQNGAGYVAVLELPDGTLDTTEVPLTDDWHTLVLGCRTHDWIGLWVDDTSPRVVHGVEHTADFVQVLIIGKTDGNWSGTTPTGTVFFDDGTLLYASYADLYVDAQNGDDSFEGLSASTPLRTIGRAAVLASAGTTVHIAPGSYRESVTVPVDGEAGKPIRFEATAGRNTVRVLGSESASSVPWTRLTDSGELDLAPGVDLNEATIWKANLSDWGLEHPPKFVVVRESDGSLTRLTLAREPDLRVETEWKHAEYWWAAEGGTSPSTCDPIAQPDCDAPTRSGEYLVDASDDTDPADAEPGSLATLGDVTGAMITVKDCLTGHFTYHRRISETLGQGKVRLARIPENYYDGCWFDHDPANPALGLYSKYYVEALPKFMDSPGEWYFDESTQSLYIWTPDGRSPDQVGIEISIRDTGFELSRRSFVELADLDILLFQEQGIRIGNGADDKSHGISFSGLDVGWSTRGIHLASSPGPGSPPESQIRTLTLIDSRIHDMDSLAMYFYTGSGADFVRPGITDARIVRNEFARIGFRDNEQGGVAVSFNRADHLLFEANHVHNVAHNGVVFSQAQSTAGSSDHDLPPEAILTGDILIRGNLFENCVQNAADAAGLNFWGATADNSHIFRDALVYRNVSRNNVGWSWVSQTRKNWMYKGQGGMGYYINYAGGMHFFRNIAYDNGLDGFMATGGWVDQGVVMANNTFVNSVSAYSLGTGGESCKTPTALDTRNTLFLHHRRSAIAVGEAEILEGNHIRMDYDVYFLNGYEPWPQHTPGILSGDIGGGYQEFPTLDQVRASLGLEEHGAEGDPKLANFDPAVDDGTWQDFRLTTESTLAIDKGTELPPSLVELLARFSIDSGQKGSALDIGAIEFDPDNPDAPYEINVGPASDGSTEPAPPWEDEDGGYTPGSQDGGAAPSSGAGSDGDGGCSCRVRGGGTSSLFGFLAMSLLLMAAGGRRKVADSGV